MEKEPVQHYSIRELTLEDGEQAHELLRRLHRETYVNESQGVTAEKVDEFFTRRTPEERRQRLEERFKNPNNARWVAVDDEGKVIGMTVSRVGEDGTKQIGALYVDKDWQGKCVAQALMQKAIDWLGANNDIELGVVAYNERAKAFYRKWGFEEIPNSETLFDDLIPEIKMIRKGEN